MFDFMIATVLAFLFGFIGYSGGLEGGRKQMHRGEYSCQTLPDKTIHCWENKENQ